MIFQPVRLFTNFFTVIVAVLLGLTILATDANAFTDKEQAHINLIRKDRPDIADKLERRLNRIESSKMTDAQKRQAREQAFNKAKSSAETAKRAAKRFGSKEQQAKANRVAILIDSFQQTYNNPLHIVTYQAVHGEVMRIREERKKAEQKKKQQGSEKSRVSMNFGAQTGQMWRPGVSFLRTELGGVIGNYRFAEVDRDDSVSGFSGSAAYQFDERPILGKQVGLSAFTSFSHNESRSHANFTNFSAMGYQLGILGVEGPAGPLGGGLITAPGFGDLNVGWYQDYYRETLLHFGIKGATDFNDTFRLITHAAFFYGTTKERSQFSGVTNANTVNFNYNNRLESDRYGLELGAKLKYPLFETGGFFLNGKFRVINNEAKGETTLTSDFLGAPFPTEMRYMSRSKVDVGGVIGGGAYMEAGNVSGYLGVEAETWQIPVIHVTGSEPARIRFDDRVSLTGKLSIRISF